MFKKCFFISILSTLTLFSCGAQKLAEVSSDKVEFAWDAHHVLLKPLILSMTRKVIFPIIKLLALAGYECGYYCISGSLGSTQKLISDLINLSKTKKGATALDYKQVVDSYSPELGTIVEEVAACWKINEGMKELIEELHQLGYKHRIATNMATQEYKNIIKRHDTFFECFDGGLTVDIEEKIVVRKPSKEYFNRYHDRYNPDRKKTIIFADDIRKHANAACETGMVGIHFKNAAQLRAELRALGIPLREK